MSVPPTVPLSCASREPYRFVADPYAAVRHYVLARPITNLFDDPLPHVGPLRVECFAQCCRGRNTGSRKAAGDSNSNVATTRSIWSWRNSARESASVRMSVSASRHESKASLGRAGTPASIPILPHSTSIGRLVGRGPFCAETSDQSDGRQLRWLIPLERPNGAHCPDSLAPVARRRSSRELLEHVRADQVGSRVGTGPHPLDHL